MQTSRLARLRRIRARDAAFPCRLAVGLAGVAFVANGGARLNVWPDVEQSFEMTRVGCLSTRRASVRALALLAPPVAPAADTCARTMVESKIWIRCADELIEARVSKKASKTPALLGRRSFPLRACGCDRGHALRAGRPRDKARQDRSTRERDRGSNCPHHRSCLRATRLRRGEPDRPSRSGP